MRKLINTTLKNGYIVSTTLIDGIYETMVLDTDFEELEQERHESEETARKVHDSYILKYSKGI